MRQKIARIMFIIGIITFVIAAGILCPCPEVFIWAAIIAGVSAWLATGRLRKWSFILLAASLIGAGGDVLSSRAEHQRQMRRHAQSNQISNAPPSVETH